MKSENFIAAAGLTLTLLTPVHAQTFPTYDPLHFCYLTGCSSFGGVTISTLGGGGLAGWGVSSSPAPQSGTLFLALLTPDNEFESVLPTLTGSLNGNPLTIEAAVNEGAFNAGADLTTLLKLALGNGASPPNPFSAFSGATLLEDPTFDGLSYNVSLIKVDGTFTTGVTAGQTPTLDNTFSFSGGDFINPVTLANNAGIGPGAIITAFLVETSVDNKGAPFIDVVSTAQSSALLITPFNSPPVPEPSTWALMGVGFAFLGYCGWRRGCKRAAAAV